MVDLDRSFVVTDDYARRAARAAFVAWHHLPRPWIRYAAYTFLVTSYALLGDRLLLLALLPALLVADVVHHYRAALRDTRTQEPLASTVLLGFGEEAFGFRTMYQARDVPYACVQKVIESHGCVVIVALTHEIFWALPAEVVTPADVARLRGRSAA